jgi:hypothetical protein
MDIFLDTFDQTKLNQEDPNHLNKSKISIEIEAVIKSLTTKKGQYLILLYSTRPLNEN